ncbi:MAG TPA: hypothetical protein DDW52_24170 [Planctomycetaceae bacterium]|nr:hypothetical protein [Planctomycetaceae bacterium]
MLDAYLLSETSVAWDEIWARALASALASGIAGLVFGYLGFLLGRRATEKSDEATARTQRSMDLSSEFWGAEFTVHRNRLWNERSRLLAFKPDGGRSTIGIFFRANTDDTKELRESLMRVIGFYQHVSMLASAGVLDRDAITFTSQFHRGFSCIFHPGLWDVRRLFPANPYRTPGASYDANEVARFDNEDEREGWDGARRRLVELREWLGEVEPEPQLTGLPANFNEGYTDAMGCRDSINNAPRWEP